MEDVRDLKALQLDALKEVANIGAGHAATALSQLTNRRIMISVPELNIARLEEGHERDFVFCVETEFHIDSAEGLRGHFLLLPDLASLKAIFDAIRLT